MRPGLDRHGLGCPGELEDGIGRLAGAGELTLDRNPGGVTEDPDGLRTEVAPYLYQIALFHSSSEYSTSRESGGDSPEEAGLPQNQIPPDDRTLNRRTEAS
jgi:hypothetical protein